MGVGNYDSYMIVSYSTCENNFKSTHLKPILNCMWFCLLLGIKDFQQIAVYVNDN